MVKQTTDSDGILLDMGATLPEGAFQSCNIAFASAALGAPLCERSARLAVQGPRPIRVGVNESVAYAWLGGWLARVRRDQPDLAFDLKVGTTDELDAMMVGGALDPRDRTRGFGCRAVQRRELAAQPMVFVGHRAPHQAGVLAGGAGQANNPRLRGAKGDGTRS
jgi:DNA-binding transcriptional LysR family regulator